MYKSDCSKENPGLHLFYCGQALQHLLMIDDAIVRFASASNLNMSGPQTALIDERKKLIEENAAYAQAEAWLLENYKSLRSELRHYAKYRIEENQKMQASLDEEVACVPVDTGAVEREASPVPESFTLPDWIESPAPVDALLAAVAPAAAKAIGIPAKSMKQSSMRNFQQAVLDWMRQVLPGWAEKKHERLFRFMEESMELVQSLGMTNDEVVRVVNYVYSRPAGQPPQELGGTMLTLAALSTAHDIDMVIEGWEELLRVYDPAVVAKIKAKHVDNGKGPPRGKDAFTGDGVSHEKR